MTTAAKPETLAQALIAFQAEAPRIPLDGANPHFNSKFASLAGVMDAVRPVLARNGLALLQHPTCAGTVENPLPALRTTLIHVSGEREEDVMLLAVEKAGPQAQGAALTYARRYAALAILGLVGDEDDDANSAEAKSEPKKRAESTNGDDAERLAKVKKALLDAGAITQVQLDTSDSKNLLARLERFATSKGVEVPA